MMVKQATMGMRAHTPLATMSLTAEQLMRIPVHPLGIEVVIFGFVLVVVHLLVLVCLIQKIGVFLFEREDFFTFLMIQEFVIVGNF
jgi:hypothetical protein